MICTIKPALCRTLNSAYCFIFGILTSHIQNLPLRLSAPAMWFSVVVAIRNEFAVQVEPNKCLEFTAALPILIFGGNPQRFYC